jgi:hypothetical protein
MIVYGPELVCIETDGQEIIHIVLPTHYAQLIRKMLEEEEDEEGTLLMTSQAHLHHLVEKIRRLSHQCCPWFGAIPQAENPSAGEKKNTAP